MQESARSTPVGLGKRRSAERRPFPGVIAAPGLRSPQVPLPSADQLLVQGGDARIALDPASGLNKYGCAATPDPTSAAFGSSTASVISEAGFAAVHRLRHRLLDREGAEPRAATYARELSRIRTALVELCGLADLSGLEVVFAASGTDIHLLAAQLVAGDRRSFLRAIMVEPAETGSGVAAALAGRHFSSRTAFGVPVAEGAGIDGTGPIDVVTVLCRKPDGTLRSESAVAGDIARRAENAAGEGKRVLLTIVDVSKTGLIVPSPAAALELRDRMPETVQLLVDACQFRLAPDTLRAYLERGCLVALTGSKFVTGPAFSGALLVPESLARRLRRKALAPALDAYTARGDWPDGWQAAASFDDPANYGLLLRWQAALAELRSFRAVPERDVRKFLATFAQAIQARLTDEPALEPLPAPVLDRRPLVQQPNWDAIPTIFPFLLRRTSPNAGATYLSMAETQRAYALLGRDLVKEFTGISRDMADVAVLRCQLGQPVPCGNRAGIPLGALRICASARHVVASIAQDEGAGVIRQALAALDKAALITRLI